AGRVARHRYGCLEPWQQDPAAYGAAVLSGRYQDCEQSVVDMLTEIMRKRVESSAHDPERFFDAQRNAEVIAHAERYYRMMYYGPAAAWNLRDQHTFEPLEPVLRHPGPDTRAVGWGHDWHPAAAGWCGKSARGEYNIGQLV